MYQIGRCGVSSLGEKQILLANRNHSHYYLYIVLEHVVQSGSKFNKK